MEVKGNAAPNAGASSTPQTPASRFKDSSKGDISVQELARNPAIEVTGYVPDLRPYVTKAAVFVCPLLAGSGIQNKLLQAMAMGTPIVTTTIATQALKVTDGVHLVIADEPQRFADAVVSLITNKKLRKELSVNARNYILEHHDWDQIGQKLEIIYRSLLNINLP